VIFDGADGAFRHNRVYKNHRIGVKIIRNANPILTHNQVRNNLGHGIEIKNASGIVSANDIGGNRLSGICISGRAANPIVLKNQIHHAHGQGVLVLDDARGSIEQNVLYRNKGGHLELALASPALVHLRNNELPSTPTAALLDSPLLQREQPEDET